MQTDLFTTLTEAQKWISQRKEEGVECPCCGQFYKIWRKKPISTAVVALIKLVRLQKKENRFYHLDDFNVVQKDRNFNQLVLWGLISPMGNDDNKKRTSGFWKATDRGIQFVNGEISIPKYVFTLNNKLVSTSSDVLITIKEALSFRFNYNELISENFTNE